MTKNVVKSQLSTNEKEIPLEIKSNQKNVTTNPPKDAEIMDNGHGCHKGQPTTYSESLIHLLKGNIGSGVFAIGEGFKNAGILLSPIFTVILGLFCLYGEHSLVNCSEMLKKHQNLDYYPPFADTVQLGFETGPKVIRAFSKYVKNAVNFFIITTHLGFCCVYFVFISSTSKQVMHFYGIDFSVRLHMVICLFPIIALSMIRTLKLLVPVSLISNVLMTFGICGTVYIMGFDFPPISSRPYVGDNIPLFFGTVMFAFEGIGLVLPLKTEMQRPEKFDSSFGVLNVGMFIIISTFTLFGFLCYLKYGDAIEPSVTLSLPSELLLSKIVKLSVAGAILFTYTLMFYIAMIVIWPYFNKKYGPFKHPLIAEMLCRTFFVFITFTLSEIIPNLGLFISLIGAVSTSFLALIAPSTCDIAMRWPSNFGELSTLWASIDIKCNRCGVYQLTGK
ncbi:proton-coupled amino acid transporter-like protein acs [Lycorma delicatula]|uniref:proton-coupled amino acid transporter-like protein acs n=1 Tax=Lycorma delicatula TaxID=130591 RepID=UPI003F517B80